MGGKDENTMSKLYRNSIFKLYEPLLLPALNNTKIKLTHLHYYRMLIIGHENEDVIKALYIQMYGVAISVNVQHKQTY